MTPKALRKIWGAAWRKSANRQMRETGTVSAMDVESDCIAAIYRRGLTDAAGIIHVLMPYPWDTALDRAESMLRREAGLWTGAKETTMHVFDICAGKSIELPNHRSVIRYDEAADAGRDQRSALPDSAVSNRPMVRLSDTEAGDRVYVQNQFTGHWLLAEVE